MKICYIFREKERKAHSIEILFDAISDEVHNRGFIIEKWYKPLSNLKSILSVRKLRADVYHITGDCYYLALFLPWNKTMMTIHDIGMYKNNAKTLKKKIFVLLSFILPMKLLKVSTAISNLTKNDLTNILDIESVKIKVIPNPLVLPISFSQKEFNVVKPRILQIGTGNHKNLIGLIEAVKGINCFLDIIGNPNHKLIEIMDKYKIDYSISVNITNEEVISKYENCDLLFFASLSEGFGLPILEAQAIGRPIITSNTEPTKSVCGAGGVLVDPNSTKEIRDAILLLINDKTVRDLCIKMGKLNVDKYKKVEIVNQYIALYNSIVNK
jgi:glycosyltransferase involved in cell wall biosynthesis